MSCLILRTTAYLLANKSCQNRKLLDVMAITVWAMPASNFDVDNAAARA
jgi:hypothetical protein